MKNSFLKFNLSSLTNDFLKTSYIQLVIFLCISFHFFFIMIVFFLNILFFNF
jgi:hypothetical protein